MIKTISKWVFACIISITMAYGGWESHGPTGEINKIMVKDGNVLAGYYVQSQWPITGSISLFRSSNYGMDWARFESDSCITYVRNFCSDSVYIYNNTTCGVFRSSNGGANWEYINTPFFNIGFEIFKVNSGKYWGFSWDSLRIANVNGQIWTPKAYPNDLSWLKVADVTGNEVYIAKDDKLYGSSNEGDTWTQMNTNSTITEYNFIISDNGFVYAGGIGGLYKSDNSGTSWINITASFSDQDFSCFWVSNGKVFACNSTGIFLSLDNGLSWNNANAGLSYNSSAGVVNLQANCITVSGGKAYIGTLFGVYETELNNINWQPVIKDINNSFVSNLSIKDNYVFAQTNNCVFKSEDNGQTWKKSNKNLEKQILKNMVKLGSKLVVSTSGGIFLSDNNGDNWSNVNLAVVADDIFRVNVYNDTVYACTKSGIYYSTDALNWIHIDVPDNLKVHIVYVSGDTIVASGTSDLAEGGLYTSTNFGLTWNYSNIAETLYQVNSFSKVGNKVYAGYGYSLYTSTNNGLTWSKSQVDKQYNQINRVAEHNGILYACSVEGLYTSSNSTSNWNLENDGLFFPYGFSNLSMNDFAVNSSHMFVASQGHGVFSKALTAGGLIPVSIYPINKETNTVIDPTFEWLAVNNAKDYNLEVATDETFANPSVSQVCTSTNVKVKGLATNTKYFWRVRANLAVVSGPWSAVTAFTTGIKSNIDSGGEDIISVSPNPASSQINVKLNIKTAQKVNIKIINELGEELMELKDVNSQCSETINTSILPSGTYNLVLEINERRIIYPVVIIK